MLSAEMEEPVEFYIHNIFGSEKAAMERVASVARKRKYDEDQIEDLKTAVSEACLNAMEHGNKMDPGKKVRISITIEESLLQVIVMDEAKGGGMKVEDPIKPPNIEEMMESKEVARGWGVFLIKSLVDDVVFDSTPDGRNFVKMTIYKEV